MAQSEVRQDRTRLGTGGRGGAVPVPLFALLPGESPRLAGEDRSHIARLAETEAVLPPILVDRSTMQVIDGMHRLVAASLNGQRTIDAEFFDGDTDEAFLRAVQANVRHGLPLSRADRRAAAARIVTSHPHVSDRAIAESTGLAARTVADIRRQAGGQQVWQVRVGRDGRARPLDAAEGRRRVTALLAEHPGASSREVARMAGVSPTTVTAVRRRLREGARPESPRRLIDRTTSTAAGTVDADPGPADVPGAPAHLGSALGKLLRDPSLRDNEQGRLLLRLLQLNAIRPDQRSEIIAAVPAHCIAVVRHLARHYAQVWLSVACGLEERMRVIDPEGAAKQGTG